MYVFIRVCRRSRWPSSKENFKRAVRTSNADALCRIISAIAQTYPKYKNLKTVFIGVIKKLTELKKFQWIHSVWFRKSSIFNYLTEKDLRSYLITQYTHQISIITLKIPSPVAEKYPKRLIQFLERGFPPAYRSKKGKDMMQSPLVCVR